jgi:peroxiredoxin
MSLSDEVFHLRRRLAGAIDPDDDRLLDAAGRLLGLLQAAEGALGVGDTLPEFLLPDREGRPVASADLLARGPLLLAFFRRGWLAACGGLLGRLEAARPAIEALGGTVVGVAPQDVHHLAGSLAARSFRILLLGDAAGRLARLCGLVCDVPLALAARGRSHGRAAPACPSGHACALPLVAAYLVGRDGVVAHAFRDAARACALEPAELVRALRALAARDVA